MCGFWSLSKALLLVYLLGIAGGCASRQPIASRTLQRFEFEQAQMGLPFRIVLYADNIATAETAARAAFDKVAELNMIFSDYEEESELSQLNRASGSNRWVKVSQPLGEVLAYSRMLSQVSHGAFDVTAGPAVNLWRRARRLKQLPAAARINEALGKIGLDKWELDSKPEGELAFLKVPGMRLDLGAIAKGYAIDKALDVLRRQGIRSALVAGSGDMAVSEPPPDRAGWRVALASPDGSDPHQNLLLKNQAVATSGDLYQRLEIDGKRYSHIVDPRTGIGLTNQSLITVVADNCMKADSLATALSVLGKEGLTLTGTKKFRAEARLAFDRNGQIEVHKTRGFDRHLE